MRKEMRRINATQSSLPGDELASQVMPGHSNHLPIVQDMAN